MPVRWATVMLFAVGVAGLQWGRDPFEPYLPATPRVTGFDRALLTPLFANESARSSAVRLRDMADEALMKGDAAHAVDLLKQALAIWALLPGAYERLGWAYELMNKPSEAAQAQAAADFFAEFGTETPRPVLADPELPLVAEATRQAGLVACRHDISADLAFDFTAPGIGVYDLDDDGRPEVICLRGPGTTHLPGRPNLLFAAQATSFVTQQTGIEEVMDAQAITAADLDGDKRPDLLVTSLPGARWYHNEGGLHFTKRSLPIPSDMWATAVAVGDIDEDGVLDLVIGGYLSRVVYANRSYAGPPFPVSREEVGEANPLLQLAANAAHPEIPLGTPAVDRRLGERLRILKGDGQGRFRDITEVSGIALYATTLNVELVDCNHDGHLDLAVINDSMPTRLFLGDGTGRFRDVTYAARFADLRSGMGLAIADFDADGNFDFLTTHFQGEMPGLFFFDRFENDIPVFRDDALAAGVGVPSLPYVGWAVFAWDFDADGDEDLLILNGHLFRQTQPPKVFRNVGGVFEDISLLLPPDLASPGLARGAAMFDWGGDGYDDLLIAQRNGPVRLLRLTPRHRRNWLRITVAMPDADALGGRIEIETNFGTQRRPIRTGSAYFSVQPRSYFFGLREETTARVRWFGRRSHVVCDVRANQTWRLSPEGCRATGRQANNQSVIP